VKETAISVGYCAFDRGCAFFRATYRCRINGLQKIQLPFKVVNEQGPTSILSSFGLNNVAGSSSDRGYFQLSNWSYSGQSFEAKLPGGTGNGSGGDGASPRIITWAGAGEIARCAFGAGRFDSNFPTRICVSFGTIADFFARQNAAAWNFRSFRRKPSTGWGCGPKRRLPSQPSVMRSSVMSMSEQDRLSPQDPLYYAPRSLRERTQPAFAPVAAAKPERPTQPASAPSIDSLLEQAVSDSLRQALDPDVMPEPPGFVLELDRRIALVSVAGRFAAAVGVSALVALFFVIVVPAWRQSDGGGSFSAAFQSLRTASKQQQSAQPTLNVKEDESRSVSAASAVVPTPDESRSALAEFQTILAPAQAPSQPSQPAVTQEQSDSLLQQFVQWQQKPASTP
jgi:hypothetical protein